MKRIVSISALIFWGLLGGEAHACPYLSCSNFQIVIPIAFYGENMPGGYYRAVQWITPEVTAAVSGWAATYFTATYTPGGLYDSAYGYDKELLINYTCGSYYSSFVHIAGEAHNKTTPLMDCTNKGPARYGTISYVDAYYGYNFDGTNAANELFAGDSSNSNYGDWGKGTSIFDHCIGFGVCDYFVEYKLWGEDPYPGHDKALMLQYWCTGGPVRSVYIPAEANHHSFTLSCN